MAKQKNTKATSNPIDKESAALSKQSADLAKQERESSKIITDLSKQKVSNLKEIKKLTQEIADIDKDVFDVSKNLTTQQLKRLELQRDIRTEQLTGLRQDQTAMDNASKHFKEVKKTAKTLREINNLEKKALPYKKALINAQKKLNAVEAQYSKTIKGSTHLVDSLEDTIRGLPLLGNFLADALNFDQVKENIETKLGDSLKNVYAKGAKEQAAAAQKQLEHYDKQVNVLKGAKTEASAIESSLTDAAGSSVMLEEGMVGAEVASTGFAAGMTAATGGLILVAGLIVGFVLAIKKIADFAIEIDKSMTQVANNLHISKSEAKELTESLHENKVLFEEQVKYSNLLNENFGAYAKKLTDSIPRLKQLQINMQLSDENMSSIVSAANLLGSSLDGSAESASEFETSALNATKEFYDQYGIQLSNSELINEFRSNLESIGKINKRNLALYGKSGSALITQIQTVKKLGLSFDQVAKTMEGVLDVEQSLESEMKANVLTGKHLNLNALREASLRGDAAQAAIEMNKALADQNINLESFNKMMPYQKKVLSEAFNMSEDELQNTLLKNKLGDETLLQRIREGKLKKDELAKTSKLTEEEAQQLILAERKTSIEQDLKEVQAELSETLKANMPGVQSFIETLADFGTRAKQVGIVRAIFGGGDSSADINEETAVKAAEEGRGSADAADKAIEARHEKENVGAGSYMGRAALYGGLGATIGTTILPVIGTAIGGAIGAGTGLLMTAVGDAIEESHHSESQERAGVVHEDFISRPGIGVQSFSKGDLIMGVDEQSLSKLSSASDSDEYSESSNSDSQLASLLKTQNDLLSTLIAKVDQPTQINISGKAIEEVERQSSIKRSYNTKFDNGYGIFG